MWFFKVVFLIIVNKWECIKVIFFFVFMNGNYFLVIIWRKIYIYIYIYKKEIKIISIY